MLKLVGGVTLATLSAGMACAGGIERSTQSTSILFDEGTVVELSYGSVDPAVSGTQQFAAPGFPGSFGASSGDVSPAYETTTLAFKTALNDKVDVALIWDQPIGASVNYATPGYAYAGSTATVESSAITALLRYKLENNFSVFGGLRNERVEGDVALFTGYSTTTDTPSDWGWVAGVAWEKPEIAARVALTYNSSITHNFAAIENDPVNAVIGASTTFATEIPQSVNLEFQTGIAKDTLLFGSVRWVDWSVFEIAPPVYSTNYPDAATGGPGALVDYDHDTITYSLGLGRRFNENWSGAITVAHEPSNGGFSGNLGPTDGYTSLGLAASYVFGNMTVTGGVRHIWIGDAVTEAPVPGGGITLGNFQDNSGFAYGFQIAYKF